MLTGELRSQVDAIWNAFWSGGISNPLEVIEQITYLLFLRRLDDLHTLEENKRLPFRCVGRVVSSAEPPARVFRTPRRLPAGEGFVFVRSLNQPDSFLAEELLGTMWKPTLRRTTRG